MLSAFLMLEQDQKSVDPRYDYFFAYMADWDEHGTLAMPANVRVISWNYDGQFEKSFAAFFEQDNQKREVVDALQIVPPVTCDQYDSGISSIYKLNGTAHIQADGSDKPGQYHDVLVHDQPDLLNAILLTLHAFDACLSGSATPSIRFAWENDPRRRDVLALIEEFAPVETLVVIGYSFPLFNRDIDRRVLELLSPKEIYLQVAKQYPAVADRIRGIGPTVDIHEVKDEDQFFIPPSYSLSERRAPRNLEL